jgi:membrane-bound lytic murein transglycosylase D
VTQILQRYFTPSKPGEGGLQTLMFRRAFDRIHKKRSRKYRVIIGACFLLLVTAGSVIWIQKSKFEKLRKTGVDIYYNMKTLELQISQLEEIVLMKADKQQLEQLRAKRENLKEMETHYDQFVKELGIYRKMGEEDRIIHQIARTFGECDLNVPPEFGKEVRQYINHWKRSDRLQKALQRSKSEGYAVVITKMMGDHQLSPYFFYIALKESEFDSRALGPKTKHGYAKGMWQFIPATAQHFGLKIGPLYRERVYDPQDERFHFEKSTDAAVRYIRDLRNTLAQASGLLVMASYNWSETKVRDILRQMPENPRDRNFWQLLKKERIPKETYDFVFYIFSAAVICENPRLFGFDFDSPFS